MVAAARLPVHLVASPRLSFQVSRRPKGVSPVQSGQQLRHVLIAANKSLFLEPGSMSWKKVKRIPEAAESDDADLPSDRDTLCDLTQQFYSSINDKDLETLDEFISEDCFYEDEAFLDPFEGKKEVMQFLAELTHSMGDHVRFKVDRLYEGHELTVGVQWHMEWKEKFVPFTRGCSFYDFCRKGEKLLLKKGYAIVECPVKPGMFVLNLLNAASSTFDLFPSVAERFLQQHREIIKLLADLYMKFVEPLILPALMYYSNIWKLVIPTFRYLVKILEQIIKIIGRNK